MTNHQKLILALAAVAGIGAGVLLTNKLDQNTPAFIDPADQSLVIPGKAIYANTCAVCHGEALQGEPNWRIRLPNGRLPAPPHNESGHTWHHPDALLFDITKYGLVPGKTAPLGYESDMPAYADTLTDEEIVAVLAYIKSSWPPAILQQQKEITQQQQANQ